MDAEEVAERGIVEILKRRSGDADSDKAKRLAEESGSSEVQRAVDELLAGECEHLRIDHVKLSDDQAYKMAEALAEALKNNYHVTEIHLEDVNLTDAGARLLTEPLSKCLSLNTIELRNCNISDDGANDILGKQYGPMLETLDLQGNRIGREVGGLLKALPLMLNLYSLDLKDNELTDGSVSKLCGILPVMQSHALHDIDLQNNSIGSKGGMAIFGLLGSSSDLPLYNIHLEGNKLGVHTDRMLVKKTGTGSYGTCFSMVSPTMEYTHVNVHTDNPTYCGGLI